MSTLDLLKNWRSCLTENQGADLDKMMSLASVTDQLLEKPPFFGDLIYFASPYTHKDKAVLEQRFHAVVEACGWYMNNRRDKYFYSPIAHTHPIASRCTLPIEWQFWANFDECILSRCSEMWILTIPGWSRSTGVNAERRISERFGLPVYFVVPQADGTYVLTHVEPLDDPA